MNRFINFTRRINFQIIKQFVFFALIMFVIPVFAVSAQAAVYAVTTTADSGAGSLRAAVAASNAAATEDIIYFSIPLTDAGCTNGVCTITLTSGEMVINRNYGLTIAGTGANSLILSGNNASRIFNVTGNGASATFTLDGVTVTKSKSTYGGAIYTANYSTLITNSIFTGNTATGGSGGGAILCNNPRCTITNTTFTGNTAPSGNGGAVVGASVANSIFTNNSASYGGAIYEPQVTSSGFTVSNSTFSNNSATGYGGAIYFDAGGTDYINATTFSGNTAVTYGGAVYEYYCSVNFSNATISGNSTTNGSGGAMYDRLGNFYFTNSTVSGNYSKFDGGGIYAYTANVYKVGMFNTILSGNTSTATAKDFYGTMDTANNNIIGDGTGATISAGTNNQVGTSAAPIDAKLAPLAYNGGFGLTRTLLVNSPAIDAGTTIGNTFNVVPSLDQRGTARVGAPDIGAFEVNNPNFAQTLPGGNTTLYYNSQLVPDSGNYIYTVTSGTLPPGLLLTAPLAAGGTVNLTGTPTLTGTYIFTVTGTDGVNTTTTVYTITIGRLLPTAAGVSVSGRVLNFKGRGIANARLILTGGDGKKRAVLTNSFGYYLFEDAPAAQTCIVTVQAKGYSFGEPSRVISLTNDLNGLNFNALP